MDNVRQVQHKKDVKYLKCVDDNWPGRATLKNENIRVNNRKRTTRCSHRRNQ